MRHLNNVLEPLPRPQIAIQDAHGITLLVQLLNTTESFEIQELVTGVFWNLSSSDTLKMHILKQALDPLVKVALYMGGVLSLESKAILKEKPLSPP